METNKELTDAELFRYYRAHITPTDDETAEYHADAHRTLFGRSIHPDTLDLNQIREVTNLAYHTQFLDKD